MGLSAEDLIRQTNTWNNTSFGSHCRTRRLRAFAMAIMCLLVICFNPVWQNESIGQCISAVLHTGMQDSA